MPLEALRRSEHNFRTLIERSPLPTCVSTVDRMLYVNQAMLEYFGYSTEGAMIGPTLAELSDQIIHPDDRARTREAFARLFANLDNARIANTTVRLDDVRMRTRRDGELRYCDMHGVAILHDGAPALVTYLHDHTERRAAAEQMRLGDRMSALGTLAAGVAHEINNPLTYVIANVELVAMEIARLGIELPTTTSALDDVRTGLDRIRRIVRALRTFSRGDDETVAPAELATVLESSIEMAQSHLRHRGRLVKHFASVPPVRGNEARLVQVFLNLLINAAQALDETKHETNEVTVTLERSENRAIVSVRDNGCGIPASALGRVFDAFYTTKPIGMGTGLGLFVCHSIVTALGGTITVESEEQRGTRVRVAIPLATRRSEPAMTAPSPVAGRRGRVLVVDDEPLVLIAVERLLSDEHDVTALSSGQQALDRLVAGERFDLVLCDLMMPGMSGGELFERISDLPDLVGRFVFMTGGAVTDAAATLAAAHVTIEKPFVPGELLALVRARI